ncbi:hypothetical protein NUU61_007789 [Penicillium alfredii]|uniref:Uncharacterized protein n=1 Tax=Penicillium alfredii TaxID=1506179 RepID=A0A9W9ER51_9EURO|nr:uncharacterized protein NUU61_007789 [Penicillium alfredii]KAJ5086482.1 hypothetical protein NUU61_007789 [Penicillium alfredii]
MRLIALLPLFSAVIPTASWKLTESYGEKCEDNKKEHTHEGTTGWGCTMIQDYAAKRVYFEGAQGYKFTFYDDMNACENRHALEELVSPQDGCRGRKSGKEFFYVYFRVDPVT